MKHLREKDIEAILVKEVKRLGGRAYKWVSPGNDGVPDRIVIFPGRAPVFVELKTETGKLTPLQESQINLLQGMGQVVFIVRGIGGLSQFFQSMGYSDISRRIDLRFNM